MFRIALCHVVIEIDNRFSYVEELCRDYICTGDSASPDFRVCVTQEDLLTYIAHVGRPMTQPEAESYLIYRQICGQMPRYHAYLLHASVVSLNGKGYAFSGARGQGKTTHTAMWERLFDATIINGDKPLIELRADGTLWAWGTPWCGKEGKQVNTSVPLCGICFLAQGVVNHIQPLDISNAVAYMLQSTMLPPTKALQDEMAYLVGTTLRCVPAYSLVCRPDEEAARLAHDTLVKSYC